MLKYPVGYIGMRLWFSEALTTKGGTERAFYMTRQKYMEFQAFVYRYNRIALFLSLDAFYCVIIYGYISCDNITDKNSFNGTGRGLLVKYLSIGTLLSQTRKFIL